MEDQLISMLVDQQEITWKSMIYDLIRSEKMDPWDVDVSVLTKKYIDMLKKLKELDLKVSGKVVLCAAILLKMKSTRLVGEDLQRLDQLFADSEEDEFDLDDDYDPYTLCSRIIISLSPGFYLVKVREYGGNSTGGYYLRVQRGSITVSHSQGSMKEKTIRQSKNKNK